VALGTKDSSLEVESLIEHSVDEALASSSTPSVHRDVLINAFVQALEKDASWVEMYGITGELIVPGLPVIGETGEALSLAAEVYKRGILSQCAKLIIILDIEKWKASRGQS
jgi:hypothetical protein